ATGGCSCLAYCGVVSCLDWSTSSCVVFLETSSSQLSMRAFPLCTAQETPDLASLRTTRSRLTRKDSTAPGGTSLRVLRMPEDGVEQVCQAAPEFQAVYAQPLTSSGAAGAPDTVLSTRVGAVPSSGARTRPPEVAIQTALPSADGAWMTGSASSPSAAVRS